MNKWSKIKSILILLFGGLFMTKHDDGVWSISLGRVSFWALLVPAILIWCQNIGTPAEAPLKDISANHYQMLFIVAGYNLGKKITNVVANKTKSKE